MAKRDKNVLAKAATTTKMPFQVLLKRHTSAPASVCTTPRTAPCLQDYETYRVAVGILHETWQEAASELDQCRLAQRKAREDEKKREADKRAHERGGNYYGSRGGGGGGRQGGFGGEYYPSGSEDDDDVDDDPFNFFFRELVGAEELVIRGSRHGGSQFVRPRYWMKPKLRRRGRGGSILESG